MSEQVTGACLCGNLKYQFDRDQVVSAHHCHCKDCQRMTGSGKATIIMMPTENLAVQGEVRMYTVAGTDGTHVSRGFCPNCGSQVISYLEEMPAMRFVKAGTLDDSSWVVVDSSFWGTSAAPWSPVDERHPVLPGNP